MSKSTAQRALASLVQSGGAVRTGKGKEIRYTRPGTPIASRMLGGEGPSGPERRRRDCLRR